MQVKYPASREFPGEPKKQTNSGDLSAFELELFF
jgi:hypothetical protein